jgi:hypothetical protein
VLVIFENFKWSVQFALLIAVLLSARYVSKLLTAFVILPLLNEDKVHTEYHNLLTSTHAENRHSA